MNTEKIQEQFHYYNIQANIDSVFGNWAVSSNGDIVNSVYPYVIFAIHLKDDDWMSILQSKVWFKTECESAFNQAFSRAMEIAALT